MVERQITTLIILSSVGYVKIWPPKGGVPSAGDAKNDWAYSSDG